MRDFRDLPNYVKVAIIILIMLLGILGALLTQPSKDKLETHHYYSYEVPEVLTAKEARNAIMKSIRSQHGEEAARWVNLINSKVREESENGSACALIDITTADREVQEYLVMAYDRAGYYQTELVPGWSTDSLPLAERRKTPGHPNGKAYLSLSW